MPGTEQLRLSDRLRVAQARPGMAAGRERRIWSLWRASHSAIRRHYRTSCG